MRRTLTALALALAVAGGALSLAAPSSAASAKPAAADALHQTQQTLAVQVQTEPARTPDAAATPVPSGTSSPSATPSGDPVNAGTGEPGESQANRTEYAPYVIGGTLLITILLVVLWRRLRRNKTPV
ncbi:MAG: hypothetical protein QOH19_949 [Actinomycetota bacterium]|jgi:cobalamin biosynthesis Mg chelatase CobN|nr:hypothetical protein [Actinomycetota bacterium]